MFQLAFEPSLGIRGGGSPPEVIDGGADPGGATIIFPTRGADGSGDGELLPVRCKLPVGGAPKVDVGLVSNPDGALGGRGIPRGPDGGCAGVGNC